MLQIPRFNSASGMFADMHLDKFKAVWQKKTVSLSNRVRGNCNGTLKVIADRSDYLLMYKLTRRTIS